MGTVKTFGERLKQLRREKSAAEWRDVEQPEVVKATGISQPNLSKYERGVMEPREVADVKALASYFRVSWIWLLHGEGQRELPSTTEVELTPPTAKGRPVVAVAGGKRRPRR